MDCSGIEIRVGRVATVKTALWFMKTMRRRGRALGVPAVEGEEVGHEVGRESEEVQERGCQFGG